MFRKKLLIIGAIVAVLAGSIVAWAASAAGGGFTINTGSSLSSGGVADVTNLGGTFTLTYGKAQVVSGVKFYQIDLGNANWSDDLFIRLYWMDPWNAGRALSNPNAWIDMQVWYAGTGEGQTTITDKNGNSVTVIQDTAAAQRMSKLAGELMIEPTVSGKSTLYILGSITTPGGREPQGQQEQLSSLDFWCDVKLRAGV